MIELQESWNIMENKSTVLREAAEKKAKVM